MFRHPKYLEIPWEIHWRHTETETHCHAWWLMALLFFVIMLIIGVEITSGTML